MTCWLLPTLWMDGWLYGDIQTICISFHLGHKTVVHGSNRGQFHTPTVSHDTEAVDVTPESAELKKKRASSCFCQTGHRPPCNKSFKLNLVSWLVNRLLLPHFSFTKGVESLNRWSLSVSQLWLWSLFCFCELGRLLKACSWDQLKLNTLQTGRGSLLKERADFGQML